MLVALVTVYLAYGVAPTFRADATILIEQQEIPEEFVRSTVTGYADERIQTISQRVMTRDNLLLIAEAQNLFPDIRESGNYADLVAAMREAIFLETVQVQTLDESRARTYPITIAFNVAFEYSIPETTRIVAEELSNLYLRENERSRSTLANETLDFLEEEAVKLRSTISEIEVRMADFKAANQNTMPELTELNREMLRSTEVELQQTREDIRVAQDRRSLLLAELRTTSPMIPMLSSLSGGTLVSPAERLLGLRSEYVRQSAIYTPDHPDLQRLRREISALEATMGAGAQSDLDLVRAELAAREVELEDARSRYSDDHPTVRRLSTMVAELRRQIAEGGSRAAPGQQPEPTSPVYVQLQVQIANVDRELQQLSQKASRLEAERDEHTARFARIPDTERNWLMLTRDYDIAVNKYEEILGQLEQARRGVTLESAQKGERFALIDPPRLPQEPIRPNRPVVLFVGLLFAIGACAGVVALLEMLDSTVRGPKDLRALLGVPALATVPYVTNARDRRTAVTRRIIVSAAFVAGILSMALIIAA